MPYWWERSKYRWFKLTERLSRTASRTAQHAHPWGSGWQKSEAAEGHRVTETGQFHHLSRLGQCSCLWAPFMLSSWFSTPLAVRKHENSYNSWKTLWLYELLYNQSQVPGKQCCMTFFLQLLFFTAQLFGPCQDLHGGIQVFLIAGSLSVVHNFGPQLIQTKSQRVYQLISMNLTWTVYF